MLLPKCLCVQSFFPKVGTLCCSASIKFSGMPQRPKPPLKDDSAMDVVKPESCDQKFEKPNKLSNCCRYKIRAFEDVSAIQMWFHSPGSLRGIVIHDFAMVSCIFMEAVSVDSIQLKVTIHSSQTYNFQHGVFGPFPWKINHLHQGIHQKRTGESLRVNYKKNVSKPILVWLHPIQTTKKWLFELSLGVLQEVWNPGVFMRTMVLAATHPSWGHDFRISVPQKWACRAAINS